MIDSARCCVWTSTTTPRWRRSSPAPRAFFQSISTRTARRAIAGRSRGTPRVANRLLKRVRDYAEVNGSGKIGLDEAHAALTILEVDELGLDDTDRRILLTIIQKFDGGPVGIETLAAATSEETDTIMDVYEPYLIQLGFLQRTPRGRIATRLAYEHLGIAVPINLALNLAPSEPQPMLFD